MSIFKRANQGGVILTFIIIAAVLVLAVIGTTFFVKQRGEQVRSDQAIAQADKLAKEAAKPATSSQTETTPVETTTPDTTPPATTEPSPIVPTTPVATEQTQSELPTTGPEMNLIQLLSVGLLVTSGAAYVMSRRNLSRSL